MSVDKPTKANPNEWKPTESEPRLTKESTPKSTPSRCLLKSLTPTNLIVSDGISACSKLSTPDSQNKSHSSTPAEPMLIDSPPSHASWIPFHEEMTEFWMGPSKSSITTKLGTILKLTPPSSPDKPKLKYPTHLPRILNLKPIDSDQESVSTESYSILSDDTIPLSPPPILTRFSSQGESEYFMGLYNTIDQAFSQWESKVGDQKADFLEFGNINDMYLEIPKFIERGVLMGKKPGGDGFWTGNIGLFGPEIILHRLEARQGKKLLGIEIGFIEDFECRRGSIGGALLFFACDRNVYYTDEDGDVDQDDQGICTFIAHGPYDLRTMGTGCVLDPWPNHPPPPVSWPNMSKSFYGH